MGLTNKQRVFVEEYLRCWNATEAALVAGYADRSARQQGSRLLTNDDIAAEIKLRVAEKAMTADEVLIRLAQHARGDMGDFLDISSMSFQVDLSGAVEKKLTHLIKKVKQRTTTTIRNDEETETHDIEIELYDAQSALVQLGRVHGLFTDKSDMNLSGPVTFKVIYEDKA